MGLRLRNDYISAQSKSEYQYPVPGRGKLDRSGQAYCDLLIRDLHIGTRPIGRVSGSKVEEIMGEAARVFHIPNVLETEDVDDMMPTTDDDMAI